MPHAPGSRPPAWRLPEGVDPALWDYVHTARLADDEDDYFAGHPLFVADAHLLDDRFKTPAPLIDLGCGVGRLALRFTRAGFPVTAVDLSQAMLAQLGRRCAAEDLPIRLLRANLCNLGCLPDSGFRYALSMFSTLGMIRSRTARRRALSETYRILEPGGQLALHAHNLWLNARVPGARLWMARQLVSGWLGQEQAGDRPMTYRGIPNMVVHLFRWGELRADLASAGFVIDEVVSLDEVDARPIPAPWLLPRVRAGGWLVFARRPA